MKSSPLKRSIVVALLVVAMLAVPALAQAPDAESTL
jgi:hypothetical protein